MYILSSLSPIPQHPSFWLWMGLEGDDWSCCRHQITRKQDFADKLKLTDQKDEWNLDPEFDLCTTSGTVHLWILAMWDKSRPLLSCLSHFSSLCDFADNSSQIQKRRTNVKSASYSLFHFKLLNQSSMFCSLSVISPKMIFWELQEILLCSWGLWKD